MADFYVPEKRTIGLILSKTSPPIRVPDYQRDYSWEEQQVSEFWYDLIGFEQQYPGNAIEGKEYFLGSAVLVNNTAYHLLLDGQQRLATATILLALLRDRIREYSAKAADQVQDQYISFEDYLSGEKQQKLELNIFDRAFFRDYIQASTRVADNPTHDSHHLIKKAYKFLSDRVAEKSTELGGGKRAFDWQGRLVTLITKHVSLVTIIATDQDHASSIFETLNDRGIGLTTSDLLRSWLLQSARAGTVEEVIECWKEIAKAPQTEVFIRLSWVARHGDIKTRALYKVIKEGLTAQAVGPLDFSRALRDDAVFYQKVRGLETEDIDLRELWSGIRTFRAQAAYSLILASRTTLPEDKQKLLTKAIVALVVRHSIVCRRDKSRIEATFFEAAKLLSAEKNYDRTVAILRALSPSDEQFQADFKTLAFGKSEHGGAQFLLRQLELKLRATGELRIAPPERVHLEHIYPQKPKEGQRWERHDENVTQIGNLTLLDRKLNEEISNSDFATKKTAGYGTSEIILTKKLLPLNAWNEELRKARQQELSTLAATVWPPDLS